MGAIPSSWEGEGWSGAEATTGREFVVPVSPMEDPMMSSPLVKLGEDAKYAILRYASAIDVDPFRLVEWRRADFARWREMEGTRLAAMRAQIDALDEMAEAHRRYVPHARTLGAAERLALAAGDDSVSVAIARWKAAARLVYDIESQMIFEELKIESARTVHLDGDGAPVLEDPAEV
jgi:hypothetical protein